MTQTLRSFRTLDLKIWGDLAGGLLLTAALASALGWLTGRPYLPLAASIVYLAIALMVAIFWPRRQASLGWANRITLLRGSLVAVILGHLIYQNSLAQEGLLLASIALVALLLDGVDGWVARRTASCSRFGRRFDMELDALLILTLCAASMILGKVGSWVLLIGLMRYAFVAAGHFLPWLKSELPDSLRRKTICVIQVSILLVILLPLIPVVWANGLAALALGLLGLSFGMDIRWLFHHRRIQTSGFNLNTLNTAGDVSHATPRLPAPCPNLSSIPSPLSSSACEPVRSIRRRTRISRKAYL